MTKMFAAAGLLMLLGAAVTMPAAHAADVVTVAKHEAGQTNTGMQTDPKTGVQTPGVQYVYDPQLAPKD